MLKRITPLLYRSSSLHYAACFGRPQVARVLLSYGANPDLRDEDGKTPLDKARERNDEGHREVASILQSPADWLASSKTIGSTDYEAKSVCNDSVVNSRDEKSQECSKSGANHAEVLYSNSGFPEIRTRTFDTIDN